jgi:hypothetical protein
LSVLIMSIILLPEKHDSVIDLTGVNDL